MHKCLHCENSVEKPTQKYCSYKCQQAFQRSEKIKLWLSGKISGIRGKTATAYWIKSYLIDVMGEKCQKCGWCEVNQHTKKIPIELEHIDGNFMNNEITNLTLLCPNCHALTGSYKGANKKSGRPRAKYYRGL